MISRAEDYLFIGQESLGQFLINGEIMPLRTGFAGYDLRGEDLCFLLEAAHRRYCAGRSETDGVRYLVDRSVGVRQINSVSSMIGNNYGHVFLKPGIPFSKTDLTPRPPGDPSQYDDVIEDYILTEGDRHNAGTVESDDPFVKANVERLFDDVADLKSKVIDIGISEYSGFGLKSHTPGFIRETPSACAYYKSVVMQSQQRKDQGYQEGEAVFYTSNIVSRVPDYHLSGGYFYHLFYGNLLVAKGAEPVEVHPFRGYLRDAFPGWVTRDRANHRFVGYYPGDIESSVRTMLAGIGKTLPSYPMERPSEGFVEHVVEVSHSGFFLGEIDGDTRWDV